MIRRGRDRLNGRVEVDEAYVGRQKEGARGRGAEGKNLVLVAVEGEVKAKLRRVRFRCVEVIDRETVETFVCDSVESGATVVTDEFSVYDGLVKKSKTKRKRTLCGYAKHTRLQYIECRSSRRDFLRLHRL